MTGKDDTMNLIAALRPAILNPAADPDRRARDLAMVNMPAPRRRVRLVAAVAVVAAAVSTIIFYDSVAQRGTTSARRILLAAATKSATQQGTGRYWRADLRSRYSGETTTPAHLAHDHQPPLWPVSITCQATIWGHGRRWTPVGSSTPRR